MCSADMRDFIERNHLDLAVEGPCRSRRATRSARTPTPTMCTTRRARGICSAISIRFDEVWDGPDADHKPNSDDIPWCRQPDRKISMEDVKYILSSHYQETPFDPYGSLGDAASRTRFRPIGINRTNHLAVMQIRPYRPQVNRAVQWLAYGSNPFTRWSRSSPTSTTRPPTCATRPRA